MSHTGIDNASSDSGTHRGSLDWGEWSWMGVRGCKNIHGNVCVCVRAL